MKNMLLYAASIMLLFGCSNVDDDVIDEIYLSTYENVFDNDTQKVGVAVACSGDWTLETKDNAVYKWIKPSVLQGKNGETVEFEVVSTPESNQKSVYVFKKGNAVAEFTAYFNSSEEDFLRLDSGDDFLAGYISHKTAVDINTNVYYRDVKVEIEKGKTWISHAMNVQNDDVYKAQVVFELAENDTDAERTAQATIIAGDASPVTVTITQKPESLIEVESPSYTLGQTGSVLEIPVTSNVEYSVSVSADWLTYNGNKAGKETFSFGSSDKFRVADITFAEKSPVPGMEAVKVVIPVTQKVKMISTAANMKKARAFVEKWNNPSVFENLSSFTIETLVKFNPDEITFNKPGTIFGIDNQFTLRRGKLLDKNRLELLYLKNDKTIGNLGGSDKDAISLPKDKWVHLAVTADNGKLTVYIDGKPVASVSDSNIATVDFTKPFDPSPTNLNPGNFFIAYSDPSEVFDGLISEFRIWNRALTENELNEDLHFYVVEPSSEGLIAYWKFNEGDGFVIKDQTSNGNNLKGQKDIEQTGFLTPKVQCVDGVNWAEVSLP